MMILFNMKRCFLTNRSLLKPPRSNFVLRTNIYARFYGSKTDLKGDGAVPSKQSVTSKGGFPLGKYPDTAVYKNKLERSAELARKDLLPWKSSPLKKLQYYIAFISVIFSTITIARYGYHLICYPEEIKELKLTFEGVLEKLL